MDKKEIINSLKRAAKIWETDVIPFRFLIVYGSAPHRYLEFQPSEGNFLHLTGIKTNLKARDFFARLVEGQLSENDFNVKPEYIENKIDVLARYPNPLTICTKIGPFSGTSVYLECDVVLGPCPCFCLKIDANGWYVPVSLMKTTMDKITSSREDIKAVFRKAKIQRGPYRLSDSLFIRSGFISSSVPPEVLE